MDHHKLAPYTMPISLHSTIDNGNTSSDQYSSIQKKTIISSSSSAHNNNNIKRSATNNNKRPITTLYESSYINNNYQYPHITNHHHHRHEHQQLKMDFSDVDETILRKYKKQYKITIKSNHLPASGKESRKELENAVAKHFANNIPDPNEKDSITSFIYALKNHDNMLKLPGRMLEPAPAKQESNNHYFSPNNNKSSFKHASPPIPPPPPPQRFPNNGSVGGNQPNYYNTTTNNNNNNNFISRIPHNLYGLLHPPYQAFKAVQDDSSLGYDIIAQMITSSGFNQSFKMFLMDELPNNISHLYHCLSDERNAHLLQNYLKDSWNRFTLRNRHH